MKIDTLSTLGLGLAIGGALFIGCSAGAGKGIDDGDTNSGPGKNSIGTNLTGNMTLPAPPGCDDGILTDDEVCDDGNRNFDDGCWGNCLGIDAGFTCPTPGELCKPFARCGDGLLSFPEQCDDGGREDGNGCSANCKLELGFKCEPGPDGPSVCSATNCGDGLIEGAEMCEPSIDLGCTSQCQFAPDCSGDGACTSQCGDGLVLGASEQCDDGNRTNGDGCDENCNTEMGYDCAVKEGECLKGENGECIVRVPVTYRDFDSSHSDFQADQCAGGQNIYPDIVEGTLTAGKPVSKSGAQCSSKMNEWFTDVPSVNTTVHGEMILYQNDEGKFVNRYGANGEQWSMEFNWGGCEQGGMDGPPGPRCFYDGNPLFFPVDGITGARTGFSATAKVGPIYGGNWLAENQIAGHTDTGPHNYHFTSEVTYWFPYDENTNATLDFTGDDDVWVFVNGKLAVDVGGIHPPQSGSVTITGASPAFGMAHGNVYEIKVFHAERRTDGSTFKLTLEGFNSRRSDCTGICGDGILAFGEECDDGVNDGGYNECQPGCVLGGFCGDGIKQEHETCDDNAPDAPADCNGCRVLVIK